MLCGSLDGREVWGRMDECICMAESLCCALEMIATLLVGYVVQFLHNAQLFANLWTIAFQAPLSMGFSRQEYFKPLDYNNLLQQQ